jgi:glycosyltransferase involved in cell wall biosynthesis
MRRAAPPCPSCSGAPHRRGDPRYETYFATEIVPRLRWTGASWQGELDRQEKLTALRHAVALLMPIAAEEPFGLVMIEAMLVGTPVIAFARGSAPEIVEHGLTGLLVRDEEEMASALSAVRTIDRQACRCRARERFNARRMAARYEALYESARARSAETTLSSP